jgi:hypothetical protein
MFGEGVEELAQVFLVSNGQSSAVTNKNIYVLTKVRNKAFKFGQTGLLKKIVLEVKIHHVGWFTPQVLRALGLF